MELPIEEIRMTEYSRGAGCGCKIAPEVLKEILQTSTHEALNEPLLVGNNTNDDAAAYDIGNGQALIATTDFFMPVVDSAYNYGRIAAANAISDVYAMGGRPILAIAILGWPVEKLPVALAQQVLEGARAVCSEVGIPLAGGHSIDTLEPIFGLAVNGLCAIASLKRNNTAKEGDYIFLTKPIGTGILSAAQKKGVLSKAHEVAHIKQMTLLNKIGEALGKIPGVTAMTDVTGFGLAGHLIEMAEGSGLSAELYYSQLRVMDGAKEYLAQRIVPGATSRNWKSYGDKIIFDAGVDVTEAFLILPDPQTNGGLLIAVAADATDGVTEVLSQQGFQDFLKPIGRMIAKGEKVFVVKQ